VTTPDPITKPPDSTPTVIVRRDVLERLQVSVVHNTIHHQCRALSRDARRAWEALDREDAATFLEEHTTTWLQYQRLQMPAAAPLEELAEHVQRSNGCLDSIKELLADPNAPVQDRRALFWELFNWATRLVGMTQAMSMRVLADLNEMIDQAGLAQAAGADVMSFRNRPPSGIEDQYQEVMERDTEQEPAAGNAPATVTSIAQLREKVDRDAVDTPSESGSRNRLLGHDPARIIQEIMRPSPKEPPDGRSA
jgi:hypothetical protein